MLRTAPCESTTTDVTPAILPSQNNETEVIFVGNKISSIVTTVKYLPGNRASWRSVFSKWASLFILRRKDLYSLSAYVWSRCAHKISEQLTVVLLCSQRFSWTLFCARSEKLKQWLEENSDSFGSSLIPHNVIEPMFLLIFLMWPPLFVVINLLDSAWVQTLIFIVDLDECSEVKNACGAAKKCVNVQGGYSCECQQGFVKKDGACVKGI